MSSSDAAAPSPAAESSATGEKQRRRSRLPSAGPVRYTPADFLFGTVLGEGSFARVRALVYRCLAATLVANCIPYVQVVHARLKGDKPRDFAVKIMDKELIKRERKVICAQPLPRFRTLSSYLCVKLDVDCVGHDGAVCAIACRAPERREDGQQLPR